MNDAQLFKQNTGLTHTQCRLLIGVCSGNWYGYYHGKTPISKQISASITGWLKVSPTELVREVRRQEALERSKRKT